MLAIETEALTHDYGPRRAIEAVSLKVPEGSIYGFLGPNGAGKTTTIRVLMGFLNPSAGTARVLGRSAWSDSRRIKAEVGYVPGDVRLWPWLTARDAVHLFARVRGVNLKPEAGRLAERLGLDLGLKVRRMSKGTRQKLGLILSMAHKPRLLILDEPSSGLDPLVQEEFRGLCREAAGEGRTVFLSSHALSEVENLCQRVAIVRKGRIIADDPLDTLRARAGHEVIVTWAGGAPRGDVPPAWEVTSRGDKVWSGVYRGPVQALVQWLATQDVADVSIGRPDLETLFLKFYNGGAQ